MSVLIHSREIQILWSQTVRQRKTKTTAINQGKASEMLTYLVRKRNKTSQIRKIWKIGIEKTKKPTGALKNVVQDRKVCKNNMRAEECGPKLTCFECDDRLTWFLCVVVEIDSVFRCGPQIAWFQCEHRNWIGFVLVVDIDLISVWGIELDLISV